MEGEVDRHVILCLYPFSSLFLSLSFMLFGLGEQESEREETDEWWDSRKEWHYSDKGMGLTHHEEDNQIMKRDKESIDGS